MPRAKTAQHQRVSTRDKYWSAEVTRSSDALDLQDRVFTWRNPKRIARSLKSSAEASERRKAGPYQAAMSMLNFYINRPERIFHRNADGCWIKQRSSCAVYSGKLSQMSSFGPVPPDRNAKVPARGCGSQPQPKGPAAMPAGTLPAIPHRWSKSARFAPPLGSLPLVRTVGRS
jgi:hypothetical protein